MANAITILCAWCERAVEIDCDVAGAGLCPGCEELLEQQPISYDESASEEVGVEQGESVTKGTSE